MSKLRVINQPLKVSDINFDDLDDEIQNYWDHKIESKEMRRVKDQRKSFKIDIGR